MNKNSKNINRKQNKQIADLQKKFAQLKTIANLPKATKRKVLKKSRVSTSKGSKLLDPVVVSVKAQVRPFDVPKGIACPLDSGRPSQKFMAKANTSVSIPSGCYMVFMANPCVASDSNRPSVVLGVQSVAGTPMSGPWKNSVAGINVVTGGTISLLSTNTPYPGTTLAGTGYEWQLCGSGIRFTYEGAELYKSGTFKYIHDIENGYNASNTDWTLKGPADIITFVDSAPNSIRQSINKNNVVEVNSYLATASYLSEGTAFYSNSTGALIGGASATAIAGTSPPCLGYFLNSSTSSISFHIETIEHWSVSAPALQALHTDSVSHPVLRDQVNNFLQSARQLHASQPNAHHTSVMASAKKAMGSPMGHEVLNAALTAALA